MKFETYRGKDGEFRWRIREEGGRIVTVKPGKIKGLGTSASKKKASERVVSLSLTQDGSNGRIRSSNPRSRQKLKSAKA
jgi:hypothetical protein